MVGNTQFVVICALACLGAASASAVLGQRNLLENGMQPDVVAKTLSAVQGEWKAQVAIFADCDKTANLPGSPIVNCRDAQRSFTKSCGTITSAIVQGSGGDKDIMNEYMGDVCKQRSMAGWHKLECNAIALAISKSLGADKYDNRMNFKSVSLCNTLWTQLLGERTQEVVKEQAKHEAADKKAAEEAAEEDRSRLEAQKKEEEQKKSDQAEREKQEGAAKAAEAKAKVAEAAAQAAEKKAEAEAAKEASAQKAAELAAATQKQEAAVKAAAEKATAGKAATDKAAIEKAAAAAERASAYKPAPEKAAADKAPAEKAKSVEETTAAKVVAKSIAKNSAKFLVAAVAPAPAAAGAPAAPAAPPVNLNDKMPLKAQEQGFTGKHVKHADGKTAAADWQKEYATKKGASFLASAAGPAPAAAKDAKKKDTKENLNDKMPLKAASQGFTGKKVEHEDGKTATSDWHKEYPTKKSSLLASAAGPAPAAAGSPAAPAAPVDLNAKMPLKAAEQGFTGKQVKHADGKTAAADWQKEYKTAAAR